MQRLLPQPMMSLLIFGLWLILAQVPSVGQFLIALSLAMGLPLATRSFWPDPPHLRAVRAGLRLLGVVLADIVTANIEVARQVIGPIGRLRPHFLEVPLGIEDPFVATILGSIISLTPGTVSVEVDRQHGLLLVHALHVEDEEEAVARIKARYEAPLKEVFGC